MLSETTASKNWVSDGQGLMRERVDRTGQLGDCVFALPGLDGARELGYRRTHRDTDLEIDLVHGVQGSQ